MRALDGKALLDHGETIARRYAKQVGADVAEELRAEAVLRALRSPAPDGRIEPWLERIYKNLLIDRWRRPQPMTVDTDALDAFAATGTPEDAVLLHERRRLVRGSLRRLPREARQVLLSRYYGELDETTTASRLGIAGPTVRTRVHRALAHLRTWLGDLRAFFPPVFDRLAGQLVAIGAAPVLVAALIVGGTAPGPQRLPTIAPLAIPAAPSLRRAEPQLLPSLTRTPMTRVRVPKRAAPATPPASVALAMEVPAPVVTEILWPEQMDLFAGPERPAPPCLVEPPTTFALQIEKMVEDEM